MKLAIAKASTNVTLTIFIQDSSSTAGSGLTGLAHNTSGLTCYYVRPLSTPAVLTLATLAGVTAAHTDGGFIELDATNMPGWYRLDLSDAVCATGVDHVGVHLKGATNMAPLPLEIQLTSFDFNSATVDVGAINGNTAAAIRIALSAGLMKPFTVDTVTNTHTPTTTEFQADDITEATTDHYKFRLAYFLTGALAEQFRDVSGYTQVGGIGQFTFTNAFTDAPANNDTGILL